MATSSLPSNVRTFFLHCLYSQLMRSYLLFLSFPLHRTGLEAIMETYAFWRPPVRTLTFEDFTTMQKQQGEQTKGLQRAGDEDIKAAMHFPACPVTGMGMSHTLLGSWLKWEDTEQRGGWKQVTGDVLWCVMELGFPGLPRAGVLRARRRSRMDFRVGQTSPSTQHELNMKRAQKD